MVKFLETYKLIQDDRKKFPRLLMNKEADQQYRLSQQREHGREDYCKILPIFKEK